MHSKRTTFLTAFLVVLVLVYLSKHAWDTYQEWQSSPAQASQHQPPLPGKNSVSNLEASRDEHGQWFVSFDYFFTGTPSNTRLTIELLGGQGDQKLLGIFPQDTPNPLAQRGAHRFKQKLSKTVGYEAATSTSIRVRMFSFVTQTINERSQTTPVDLAVQQLPLEINWPDHATALILNDLRTKTPEDFLATAIELIDKGQAPGVAQARQRIDHLLQKHPQLHSAYLELARVAMKTNWGPEGLRQAETYIDAARKLAPDDPNVWILQGYVYAYQGRYKEAEPLFIAASKTATSNLWLWTNWGELSLLQGKVPQATDRFRKAVDAPPPGNTYDQARKHAYWQLFKILDKKSQLDLAESLYEKRYADYNSVACYGAELAQFMLMKRGNAARAAELAGQAALATCEEPDPKEILGMAHYASWVEAPATEKAERLNRARVVFPSGTRLIYMLAGSDHTVKALKALQSGGESIDQLDNHKMNALAYALSNKDHDTARRLLRLQARTNLDIGAAAIPMALIPVIAEDYLGIKLLRQFGVDYTKVRYQNMTAIDHAKRIDNRKLLEALDANQSQRL